MMSEREKDGFDHVKSNQIREVGIKWHDQDMKTVIERFLFGKWNPLIDD